MLPPVIRGSVTDRPWGATLARLMTARSTGELVVIADGKRYAIALNHGGVVGAYAPGAADSVGRIALTSHLVSSTQVAEITRRIAAQPERDEIEVIAETARLSQAQADALRRRVIGQRAARTFALEQGAFAFDDKVLTKDLRGGAIDTRSVIYLGARMHVSEPRLANELRGLGHRFVLLLDALDDLPRFGFNDAEKPVLEALRRGTTVAELELTHRELDPRMISACVYTLACCGAIGDTGGPRIEEPVVARVQTPAKLVNMRASTEHPVVSRTMTPPPVVARTTTPPPVVSRTMTPPPVVSRTATPISERPRVSTEQSAPIAISRTMTPTPTPAVARTQTASPPFAQGSSPALKSVTIPPVAIARTVTPPAGVVEPRTTTKDLDARDAFQRGEMAMRREQLGEAIQAFGRAVELMPEHPDYISTLAWAKFCAAQDKGSIAEETRAAFKKAMRHDADSVTARMCFGRVERMLGRDREALDYFRQVLELQPRHTAAASEARVLEARVK